MLQAEVAAAREALPEWAHHSVSYRSEALRRFANVVRKSEEEFATLIARETGKPLWEARTEVAAVINKVDISIHAYAERTPKRTIEAAMGSKVSVRHKPHGVLGVLGPYNFPAHLPNGHIVPALLAGNAVVFKPSEKTPACGEFLVSCFHKAGIPEGLVRLLIGGPDEGRALASQDGLDGLLFTGSARAGMSLHRQFADSPHKLLALELGGNNPLVVWEPKDIEVAAAIAVQSAYLSAGQRCTAARRLIVHDGKEGPLVEAITALIDRIIVDEPFADPPPFMGPVIDNADRRPSARAMGRADDQGRQADPPARPAVRGPALSDPGADRRNRRQRPARRRDFRPRAAAGPGQGLRRRDRRGQRHPLRPGGEPGRRQPGAVRPLLGRRCARA